MKKIFLTLSVMFALSQANGQCHMIRHTRTGSSSVTMTFTGGSDKTANFELGGRFGRIHLGAGVGVMIDTQMHNQDGIEYKRNDTAVFGTLGYQRENLVVGVRLGTQKFIAVTGVVNGVQQRIPEETTTMIGVFAGYCISETTRVNFGIDTFNKVSLGLTFGL
jgi:hypothetical protein